ncbi:MAG: transglycosylase domain-containing protein [Caldilineaceae bacterium]
MQSWTFLLIGLVLFSSCQTPQPVQAPIKLSEVTRPSGYLVDAVEKYLEEYQPGPLPRLFQTTHVYDRHGVLLAELWNEGKRTWVSIDDMAPALITATVSTEDATFFTNWGYDPFRIAAAVFQNYSSGEIVSGASTITMQLARNLFLGPEKRYDQSFDRKLLELGLAQELTDLYSKRELLEMYLNLNNYGNLMYGPEAASQLYFGKAAKELTFAEATLLAGIPQQPFEFDPYHNFQAVKKRQRTVLDLMVAHLDITSAQADEVYNEPITLTLPMTQTSVLAPQFVQYAELMLDKRFGESGYTRRSGYHIFTTLDLDMQAMAQKIVNEKIRQFRLRYNLSNASLVAMRPYSGEVLTMVGSADFYDESIDGQVNVALRRRQPGSTLKPILYAMAMSDNLLTPATVMWDTPVAYDQGNGLFYRPQNYDSQFHGLVTARTALANSFNIPAVKLLDGLGIQRALKGLDRFGIHSLQNDPYFGLGLALGANEITLMELTNAYNVIASGGDYVVPEVALNAYDSQQRAVTLPPRPDPVRVITRAAAFQITDILSDNDARRPMFGANSALKLSRPAAAKTGTTSDFRDNWTMGFTRFLVTGVWTGNSNGQPMRDSTGVTGAAPIWNAFNEAVLADKRMLELIGVPPKDKTVWNFVPPSDVQQVKACPPNLYCRASGEWFSKSWLEATGDRGPLADSFSKVPSVSIYNGRADDHWTPVYCESPEGKVREMLNLTGQLGLPDSQLTPIEENEDVAPSTSATVTIQSSAGSARLKAEDPQASGHAVTIHFFPEHEIERFNALAWGVYRGLAINLGDCTRLSYYTVQPGDSWGAIANQYGLPYGTLQAANQGFVRDGAVLLPGDTLLVPTGSTFTIGVNGRSYQVHSGDTWASIANSFGIPLKILLAVNPEINRPYLILRPGDNVWIPDKDEVDRAMG